MQQNLQRQREDTILKALLREIWQNNYKAYGAPRLRLALADLNLHHGTNRVRRLMREAGIYSVMSRRFNKPTTTVDYRQRPNKPLGYWIDLAHKKFRF